MPRRAWVYICASLSRTLYIGVTSDLPARVTQHRAHTSGFTARYLVDRLVYFEEAPDLRSAIARENQLKRWARWKKVRLMDAANHDWLDLARDWFPTWRRPDPSTSLGMTAMRPDDSDAPGTTPTRRGRLRCKPAPAFRPSALPPYRPSALPPAGRPPGFHTGTGPFASSRTASAAAAMTAVMCAMSTRSASSLGR